MLVYHPAFDSYHCLFRSIAILEVCKTSEPDRLRILDLCLSFPSLVSDFRLPQGKGLSALRKAARQTASPYRDPINANIVFANLAVIQTATFKFLNATGLTSSNAEFISRTDLRLPENMKKRCSDIQEKESVFFDKLLSQLIELPLLGANGLKARSGLMEYQYDTI